MGNLIKVLLALVNDKKISEKDCSDIIIAAMLDNVTDVSVGISNKPIELISQETIEELSKLYNK